MAAGGKCRPHCSLAQRDIGTVIVNIVACGLRGVSIELHAVGNRHIPLECKNAAAEGLCRIAVDLAALDPQAGVLMRRIVKDCAAHMPLAARDLAVLNHNGNR